MDIMKQPYQYKVETRGYTKRSPCIYREKRLKININSCHYSLNPACKKAR